MIAVRKEDQPKVIALVVLLVLVLAFVVRTVTSALGGSKGEPTPVARAEEPAPVAPAPPGTFPTMPQPGPSLVAMNYGALPAPNEVNPFRSVLPIEGAGSGSSPVPPPPTRPIADRSVRSLPGTLPGGSPVPFNPGGVGNASIVPRTITLNGIVSGRGLLAMVTVGERTETVRVGSTFEGFTLAVLTETRAVFTTRFGRLTMSVGDSKTAPIG